MSKFSKKDHYILFFISLSIFLLIHLLNLYRLKDNIGAFGFFGVLGIVMAFFFAHWFKTLSQIKEPSDKEVFMSFHKMSFDFGLTVNGLIVNEFRYLLQHYSNHNLTSFDNLDLLSKYKDEIVKNIKLDLAKDDKDMAEAVLTVNARYNANNLINIINVLDEYNTKFNQENKVS